ncbi:hypothetical protein [Leifsonia sp. Leaf336]|uniref:hypothetical protein n=1 Tax=Leifsonia sp. Leaf336 TaxID=1736341 RepID=UPI0012FB4B45|nr:hypothetical protein [Leifsonia sp. Leaf336]
MTGFTRFLRGLYIVPVLVALVALDGIASNLGAAQTTDFRLGVLIGSLVAAVVITTPVVVANVHASVRLRKLKQLNPTVLVWEAALDPATAASLIALDPLRGPTGLVRFGLTALTIAAGPGTIRGYVGSRRLQEVFAFSAQQLTSIQDVRVSNGWGSVPGVRLDLQTEAGRCSLFLSIRSRSLPGLRSRRECRNLITHVLTETTNLPPSEPREVGAHSPESTTLSTLSTNARGTFEALLGVTTALGLLYVSGIAGHILNAVGATWPPIVMGVASSPLLACLLGIVILGFQRRFARAFFDEISHGYTTLRWLVGVVPQRDVTSGLILRNAGTEPLS